VILRKGPQQTVNSSQVDMGPALAHRLLGVEEASPEAGQMRVLALLYHDIGLLQTAHEP
jgi:hypothetical protein